MSADNITGEARLCGPAPSSTHLPDYSVMSGTNILTRDTKPCNEPKLKETRRVSAPVSGGRVATSPAAAPPPATPPTPGSGADLGQGAGAEASGGGDEDSVLSGPLEATPGTLSHTVIPSSNHGPSPSEEVDACARTAFSGIMGHKNAISDECSSNGGCPEPGPRQSDGAGAGLARSAPTSSPAEDNTPALSRVVCETKTVNQPNYDIPSPGRQDSAASPSLTAAMEDEDSSFNPATQPTEPATSAAMTSLSAVKPFPPEVSARRGGWRLPPGGGLRGGAPLPGETSAISNGTSGWGPPPSASGDRGGTGTSGWGATPAAAPSGGWGAAPSQNINNGDADPGSVAGLVAAGPPASTKMLNTLPPSQQQPGPASQAPGPGLGAAPGPVQGPGPAAVQGSTSWAAAAGKGLPPSENAGGQGGGGSTNKQLEQLNSVREALFSQDGWGAPHVKQDTSWDVGASGGQPTEPPPAAAAAAAVPPVPGVQPPKGGESMQWTPPGGPSRNDGTELWRTTLSGVPAPSKPQPNTPWGNHTPAHPADYKTWGEPDGQDGGGGEAAGPGPGPSQPEPAANMWGGAAAPGSGPGSSGSGGAPAAWEQERGGDRPQFDDRERQNWGGVSKPKDEAMGWSGSAGPGQWGPGGPGANNGGSGGWGPPPAKGGAGAGPAGGWGNNGAPGPRPPQWENDSPTMGRRFDDGGTGIWGGNKQAAMPGGPPGGWKDMPVPNIGSRGPQGPGRMPPGPGAVKPAENSPWGAPHPARGWDTENIASQAPGGWGAGLEDAKPRSAAGPGAGMWSSDGDKSWGGGRAGAPQLPGMRSSPSWEDGPGGAAGGMMPDRAGGWGAGGPGAAGGAGVRPNVSKEIWNSKQFRILCEMGFRKEDVETALRNTNMQLDDALEMLNALNRGGMPGGGRGMPPNDVFGPRGEPDYGMRFPGPGPMPYPPGSGDMPGGAGGSAANLAVNPSRPANLNPSLPMNGGPNMHAPPRPQPSGPPSTAQLRVLVQQIQMAVQAGHLNPQILNQPLAPQTLYLLNQLLQQIKQLQTYQQQHAMAQAQAGQRPGASQQQALMGLTVQITKHKQQIQNLQNQITAQQAQYLMSQQSGQPKPGSNGPGAGDTDLSLNMGGMSISGPAENGAGPGSGGSKLLQMINKADTADTGFPRAPGSSAKTGSASSPNLLLDNGPWSNGGGNSGWPDSTDRPVNTSNSTDEDNFGIPEFVPGKAWKGTALTKDPTEDPTLTPGSVASSGIIGQATTSEKTVGSGPTSSSDNPSALSSSTWSLATPNTKESGVKDSWGLPTSSSANTLTEMGQNLWGVSRPQSSKQQTPTSTLSTWPSSNGGSWSNGGTTTTSSYANLGTIGQPGAGAGAGAASPSSTWLLLKNLTAQIDGSTLRTLCLQHGPLTNFHLYLTHGIAMVKYSNGLEAKKAQNALNNCVLGNTTILAATAEEPEVESIIRQLSQHGTGAGGGYSATPSNAASIGKSQSSSSGVDTWAALGSGVGASAGLGWPSSVWGPSAGDAAGDSAGHNRTTPLNSFLPPDLLSEGM